jgi:periplasmic divalent cation tolerance protein
MQIDTTFHSREKAEEVATVLVGRRLIACAQIFGPIMSIYRWEGQMQTKTEWKAVFKTRRDRSDLVEQALRELHNYDTPEFLGTVCDEADVRYLRWMDEGLDGESGIWSRRRKPDA